jgi:hypothetical protein
MDSNGIVPAQPGPFAADLWFFTRTSHYCEQIHENFTGFEARFQKMLDVAADGTQAIHKPAGLPDAA